MNLTGLPGGWRIIKPIRTKYRGITFRSTLEADWAATLDSLRIGWQYEPQGLTLSSGVLYRPDFYLPAIGTWLEVKGPGVPGAEKAIELADAIRCSCFGSDLDNDVRVDDGQDWFLASDLCECRWPGGEKVVIGLPSVPGIDGKSYGHGYTAWINPRGITLGLTKCRNCDACWWIEVSDNPRTVTCRRCFSPTRSDEWALSGEVPFMRAKSGRWFSRRWRAA